MSCKFNKIGSLFFPVTGASGQLMDALPVGNYTIKYDKDRGFFLEVAEDFTVPNKIYGNDEQFVTRVLTSYMNRSSNTGVALVGEKGSGKTMDAKLMSIKAKALGIPTYIIAAPFYGLAFSNFLDSLPDGIVNIDEFEKVYNENIGESKGEAQNSLLTVMEGMSSSKKLFVMTVNNEWAINSYMRNRPGRIFYMKRYTGVSDEFIQEYLDDNLEYKEGCEGFFRISSNVDNFNFDMLKALVEEVNRYKMSPLEAVTVMNIHQSNSGNTYDVNVVFKGVKIPSSDLMDDDIQLNPFNLSKLRVHFRPNANVPGFHKKGDTIYTGDNQFVGEENEWTCISIEERDIKSRTINEVVCSTDEAIVTLTRREKYQYNAF